MKRDTNPREPLVRLLRSYRYVHRLSVSAIARKAGVSRWTIGEVLAGRAPYGCGPFVKLRVLWPELTMDQILSVRATDRIDWSKYPTRGRRT